MKAGGSSCEDPVAGPQATSGFRWTWTRSSPRPASRASVSWRPSISWRSRAAWCRSRGPAAVTGSAGRLQPGRGGRRNERRFASREARDAGAWSRWSASTHRAATRGGCSPTSARTARPTAATAAGASAIAPARCRPGRRRLGEAEKAALRDLLAQGHAALATPRQLARFLCGITSPAATRAKLQKGPLFGAWRRCPSRTC